MKGKGVGAEAKKRSGRRGVLLGDLSQNKSNLGRGKTRNIAEYTWRDNAENGYIMGIRSGSIMYVEGLHIDMKEKEKVSRNPTLQLSGPPLLSCSVSMNFF